VTNEKPTIDKSSRRLKSYRMVWSPALLIRWNYNEASRRKRSWGSL